MDFFNSWWVLSKCAIPEGKKRQTEEDASLKKILFTDAFIHCIFIKHLLRASILLGPEDTKITVRGLSSLLGVGGGQLANKAFQKFSS